MRLVCPNCGAEYEVPSEVIPPEGRDVQCSSCGQTWFQGAVDAVIEHVPDEDVALSETILESSEPTVESPEPEASEPEEFDEPTLPERHGGGSGRQLAPEVAQILREEAMREEAARRADRLESQQDLGQEDVPTSVPETDAEDMHAEEELPENSGQEGEDEQEESAPDLSTRAAVAAAVAGSRRALLPDVEEINSTLGTSSEARTASAEAETEAEVDVAAAMPVREAGRSRGFWLVVILSLSATAIYVFAPQIAARFPELGPVLTAYVGFANIARDWLAEQFSRMLTWLDTMASHAHDTPSG